MRGEVFLKSHAFLFCLRLCLFKRFFTQTGLFALLLFCRQVGFYLLEVDKGGVGVVIKAEFRRLCLHHLDVAGALCLTFGVVEIFGVVVIDNFRALAFEQGGVRLFLEEQDGG